MPSEDLNRLSNKIIGLAIKIHKQLGPGFVEKIYEGALAYEFKKNRVNFVQQKVIKVKYEDLEFGNQRVDFLIEGEVILEVKSTSRIIGIYQDQILSYLKTSNTKLGLILNFGTKKLEIKRVVNQF